MSTKPHLIHLELSDDWIGIRIECPGTEEGGCFYWVEDMDLSPVGCHCVEGPDGGPCESCANDDHYGCPDVFHVEGLGPSCRCLPVHGRCAVLDADCAESELIHGDDWPKDEYPLRARLEWTDGFPELHPWKDE